MACLAIVPRVIPDKVQFAPRIETLPDRTDARIDWTRGSALALARNQCTCCHGSGLTLDRRGCFRPCDCVSRNIFRLVIERRQILRSPVSSGMEILAAILSAPQKGGKRRGTTWGFKTAEFCADVDLCVNRTLRGRDRKIYWLHFHGLDGDALARKLGCTRPYVYRRLQEIEAKLGRKFAEMAPYPLYPVDEYFCGRAIVRRHARIQNHLEQAA